MARMKKKTNKKTKRTKRLFFVTIFCLAINAYVLYSVGIIFKDVYEKKHEKKLLVVKLDNLKEEQEKLKVEVNKLQDEEYIARYAREKYLYSGKDEYIIRIK